MNTMNHTKRIIPLAFAAMLAAGTISTSATISAGMDLHVSHIGRRLRVHLRRDDALGLEAERLSPVSYRVYNDSTKEWMAIDSDQGEPQVNGLVTGQWLINEWEVIPGNYSVMAKYWTEKSMSDATWNNGAPEWQLQPRAPLPTKHYNSVQRARAARRMDALCVNVDVNPEHDGERRYWHSTTFGESMVTVRNTEVHLHHDALNEFSQSLNGCVAVTFVLNSRGELVPINNTDKPDSPPACLVVKSPGDALSLRSALGPGDYTFRTVAVSQAEAKSWTSTRRFGNRDHGSIPVRLTTVDPHSYAHTAAGHTIVADVPFSV